MVNFNVVVASLQAVQPDGVARRAPLAEGAFAQLLALLTASLLPAPLPVATGKNDGREAGNATRPGTPRAAFPGPATTAPVIAGAGALQVAAQAPVPVFTGGPWEASPPPAVARLVPQTVPATPGPGGWVEGAAPAAVPVSPAAMTGDGGAGLWASGPPGRTAPEPLPVTPQGEQASPGPPAVTAAQALPVNGKAAGEAEPAGPLPAPAKEPVFPGDGKAEATASRPVAVPAAEEVSSPPGAEGQAARIAETARSRVTVEGRPIAVTRPGDAQQTGVTIPRATVGDEIIAVTKRTEQAGGRPPAAPAGLPPEGSAGARHPATSGGDGGLPARNLEVAPVLAAPTPPPVAAADGGPSQAGQAIPRQEIFNQLVEKVRLMLAEGHSHLEVRLKPEHLGRVELRVSLAGNLLQVQLLADNPRVGQVLEAGLPQLRQQMEAQGLQLQQLSVELGSPQAGGQSAGFASPQEGWQSRRWTDAVPYREREDEALPPVRGPRNGVDLLA